MIRSSVESDLKNQDEKWPMSPNKLAERLNTKPIAALYNAIFLTVYSQCKYSDYGYAETKYKAIANKIWSIASDWTSLITGKRSSKQIMVGMTLHCITASREVATTLNKSGHCISCNDIRLLEDHWANLNSTNKEIFDGLIKSHPTHFNLDNNNACQETMTGLETTHHTNLLIFQPLTLGKNSCKK